MINTLVENGACLNAVDSKGRTGRPIQMFYTYSFNSYFNMQW